MSRGFQTTLQADEIHVFTDQIKTLQELRCAQELLLPVASSVPIDAGQIASLASAVLTRPYRIELRNYTGDRAAFIRAISLAPGRRGQPVPAMPTSCGSSAIKTTATSSSVQRMCRIRVLPTASAPFPPPSIQFMRRASRAMRSRFVSKARPRTLDPFCGSGTLLFELERVVSAPMIGVDISERTLDAARERTRRPRTAAHALCIKTS